MPPFIVDVQHVSEGIDSMLANVARRQEALHWGGLVQVLENVVNHPRDISYVVQLARAAQDIESVFQLHQDIMNTMTQSNGRLHGLLQEALQWNDSEGSQPMQQLLAGLRSISERIDRMLADGARSQDALHWVKIRQLLEDTRNHPRDIAYTTSLARAARDLQGIFQLHQNMLDRAAESNHLLQNLISQAFAEGTGT